ncbi:MAG: triose-phosphate isomerase [Oceanicoccus sp.]
MRRSLVVGNWKMVGSRAGVVGLLEELQDHQLGDQGDVAVCPPYVFLPQVSESLQASSIRWGAQNLSQYSEGAFTGEVSASMLADFGCDYTIVGHSERRSLFGERDVDVAEKFVAAQSAGLIPILCVGESLQQRESGQTLDWVEGQITAVIEVAGVEAFVNAVIAYEPIWAIGTGKTASPEQAQQVHAHIRGVVASGNAQIASNLRILYGGSVKANNASELFANPDIDGALVGGASLIAVDFAAICRAAG